MFQLGHRGVGEDVSDYWNSRVRTRFRHAKDVNDGSLLLVMWLTLYPIALGLALVDRYIINLKARR